MTGIRKKNKILGFIFAVLAVWMGIFQSTLCFRIDSLYHRTYCFEEGHIEKFCANGNN